MNEKARSTCCLVENAKLMNFLITHDAIRFKLQIITVTQRNNRRETFISTINTSIRGIRENNFINAYNDIHRNMNMKSGRTVINFLQDIRFIYC